MPFVSLSSHQKRKCLLKEFARPGFAVVTVSGMRDQVRLARNAVLAAIIIEHFCKCRSETNFMRSALCSWNVVDIRKKRFIIAIIMLKGYFN